MSASKIVGQTDILSLVPLGTGDSTGAANLESCGAHQSATEFMAGVRLFDALLKQAERLAYDEDIGRSGFLVAGEREGKPLHNYALQFVDQLLSRPQLAPGFAAALGDYVEWLQQGMAPSEGQQYDELSLQDIFGPSKLVSHQSGSEREELRHG